VFVDLGVEPVAAASSALEGLRQHHDRQVGGVAEARLRDLFLIDCATRAEALERVLYDALLALAADVGAAAEPLRANRDEEAEAQRRLEGARRELLALL
jgi:ferritin-like metal-binding protein YciE